MVSCPSIAVLPYTVPRFFFFQDELCLVRFFTLFRQAVPLTLSSSHPRLGSIGNGGFSHDFGSLKVKTSPVMTALDSFGSVKPSFIVMLTFLLGHLSPRLASWLPTERTHTTKGLTRSVQGIASDLLDNAANEKAAGMKEGQGDKSIIGALGKVTFFFRNLKMIRRGAVRSETASSNIHMSIDEIMAQVSSTRAPPKVSALLKLRTTRW